MKRLHLQLTIALALMALVQAGPALAQTMTSASYRIPFDDISGGGVFSSSSNYKVTDTISEVSTPTGEGMASASYKACAGFECLQEAGFLNITIATSASPCTGTTASSPPFTIPLGTLTTGAVTTGSLHICVIASSNVLTNVATVVSDSNGGLGSVAKPTDVITSQTATLTAATQGYGVCSANASGGFTATSPYNGSCNTSTSHAVGRLQTSQQTIYTATGPLDKAFGDVLVKASISGTTPAHNDYGDSIVFVVTATY